MGIERKRKFAPEANKKGVQESRRSERVPTSALAQNLVREIIKWLIPKTDEVPHSQSYLSRAKGKRKDYESNWLRHPAKSAKARHDAYYELYQPVIVGGRRVHRYVIPIVGAVFFITVSALYSVLVW